MSQTRPDAWGAVRGRDPGFARWRWGRLVVAGFESRLAAELAVDPAVDVHEVLVLVDRGCPPVLAARIVAPLDGDGG